MAELFDNRQDWQRAAQETANPQGSMREALGERFQQSVAQVQANHKMPDEVIGALYDSPLAKGIHGALNDIYRRVFEVAWFGHDIYDGRMHFDNQASNDNQSIEGMGEQYDQRAAYYGWDQDGQQHGLDTQQEQEQEMER